MDDPTHYYYTISVDEESHVAHALDDKGAVLVSLDYVDETELCSDEFQRCMSDAVALMHLDGSSGLEKKDSDDVMMEIWREEDMSQRALDEARVFSDVEAKQRLEESDRDFALALLAQEREQEETRRRKSVWGTMAQDNHGVVSPLRDSRAAGSIDTDEFPSLSVNRESKKVESFRPTGNILESMTRKQSAGQRLYNDSQIAMDDWKAVDDDRVQKEFKHRIGHNDRDFILSSVATRETRGHGVSPGSLKTMMEASSGHCEKQDTVPSEEFENRERYSRKSIRKLVLDMIQAGWVPMPGRGGGHYMYQRNVPVPGQSPITQILVIPSTPSSQKSIDRVYAKLIKCDREIAEKLKEIQFSNS